MEFSFDRSNAQSSGSQPKPAEPAAQAQTAHPDGIDTSTIANERLRKAIEKNRARQAERARMQPQSTQQAAEPQAQASFFDQQAQQQQQFHEQKAAEQRMAEQRAAASESSSEEQPAPRPRPRAQERTHAAPKTAAVVTRRSVARPDEAEFTPVKRPPRKVASQISYTTNSRKKSKPLDPKLVNYLVKGCWIFCAVMVLRLIFANGGVTDFYSQRSLHADRLNELDRIKKENMQLVHEIERMKTDTAFQKKLVRDNLGFIASDEFLILFPKEKTIQ